MNKHRINNRLLGCLSLISIVIVSTALQAADPDSSEPAPVEQDAGGNSAAVSDSGSDPRILPDLEQERLSALANSQRPGTQTLWLETAHESFLGLYKPANRPIAQGAVLLLHHDRTSADWPGAITTLRSGLPDQGWHTLSVALPDEPEYIPPRVDNVTLSISDNDTNTDTVENNQAAAPTEQQPTESDDKLADHYQQISARIEAGLAQLQQQQPEKLVVIGEGSGAYWALRFAVDKQQGQQLFSGTDQRG